MHEVALVAVTEFLEIEHPVPETLKLIVPLPVPPDVKSATLVRIRLVNKVFEIIKAACWTSENVKVFDGETTAL